MSLFAQDTLTATGASDAWTPARDRDFNITVRGTWAGSVYIERTLDDGTTWDRMTYGGVPYEYIDNFSEPFGEVESKTQWRLWFERTSGTLELLVTGKVGGRP